LPAKREAPGGDPSGPHDANELNMPLVLPLAMHANIHIVRVSSFDLKPEFKPTRQKLEPIILLSVLESGALFHRIPRLHSC